MRRLLYAVLVLLTCGLAGFWGWRHSGRIRPASVIADSSAQPPPPAANVAEPPRGTPPAPAAGGAQAGGGAGDKAQIFGAGDPVTLTDVPAGRFHDELTRLSGPARQRALEQLGRLRVPVNDVGSLAVDDSGALYYECAPPDALSALAEQGASEAVSASASVPAGSPPVWHSRPGSANVIYLDFNGHTIVSTAWNNAKGTPGEAGYRPAVTAYVAQPYDNDGDPTTFSASEQYFIEQIWRRVKEDYIGFDVDVTTEEPAVFTPTTGRALITRSVDANAISMPSPNAGGVAYVGVFGLSEYPSLFSPALIYYDNLMGYSSYVAEAVSHEMGHNLSLSHDGTASSEYYQGHGYGETSWAPIMGSSYYANVSQWSKGEYYNSNNPQDDLLILAGHLGYAADDHADGEGAASPLPVVDAGFSGQGIIGAPGDADWFVLTAPLRAVRIQANPFHSSSFTAGGNLDLRLELYDAAGHRIAQDPSDSIAATSAVLEAGLTAGTYYLKVSGVGAGTPLVNPPWGYTAYGSLGQYTITGVLSDPLPPVITSQPAGQSVEAGQYAYFTVYSGNGNPTPDYRWQRLPAGGSAWVDLADDATYANTGAYNLMLSAVSLDMDGDQFRCRIFNVAGEVVSQVAALAVRPAVAPQVYNMTPFQPVNYGETLSLYPAVAGTLPMTFVWKKDGVELAGATQQYFTKAGVTTADNGLYTLTATNLGGTVTSSATTVAVNPPVAPAIYNLPQLVAPAYGGSVNFYATVTGTQPLAYEWRKDGVVIPGATSYTYSRSNLTLADAGVYTLTATNAWGTTTSAPINVTVSAATAPTIFGLPASQTLAYGSYLSLTPSVAGTAPISYQWSKDGQPITGATSSGFYKNNVTLADSGVYTLTASNAQGTVTSSELTLTVDPPIPPSVYGLPAAFTVDYGGYINLSGSVSGTTPLTLAWKKDGVAIPGATSAYFSKSNATTADSGSYALTATNVAGSATSTSVLVTVRSATAPVIFGLPATVVVAYGQQLNLSPSVLGSPPITYQWKKDGVDIPDATWSSLYKSGMTAADAGIYTLTATNFVGSATSLPVTVLVDVAAAPAIYGLPESMTVAYGETLSLSPSITGTQPIAFQWKKDELVLDGKTSSYLSKSGITAADAGNYTLIATNAWGTATSLPVAVAVSPAVAPTISNLPPFLTVAYGNSWQLYPAVTGTQPITCVWTKDGITIPGATSSYFSRSYSTAADSGSYTLTATNLAGSTTSISTVVTVTPAFLPVISSMGGPIVVNYGDSFSFYPSVSGTQPITYQWKKDGVAIPQATSLYFSRSLVTTADSGSYTLTATNLVGSVTSASVSVTVNPPVAPAVYGMPAVVALNYGGYLSLYPSIIGSSPRTYRWQKDGADLSGGTDSSYYKSNVTGADSGVYTLTVTNAFGSATSEPVTVAVNAAIAPEIYNAPSSLTVDYGVGFSISPTVVGTSPIYYVWKKDGEVIPGATSSSFYKGYATVADSGQYTLVASNLAGSATSPIITLVVRAPIAPTVTVHPLPVTVSPGLTASFYVQATGTSPLNYQWYRESQPIPGATTATLTLANVRPEDFASYHVVVTNTGGSVASDPAALTPDSGLAVVAVAAGSDRGYWIRSDGTLWGAGSNNSGQLGDGSNTSRYNARQIAAAVTSVCADVAHTLFLKFDGTLWATGGNYAGQFGNGTTVGSVSPLQVASGVTALAAGSSSSYLIKADGSLWAAGENNSGQLGDGTTMSRATPVQVATGVTAVAAGSWHVLFIKADGTLWATGQNYSGQLGDGTTIPRSTPVQVATGVVAAAAGYAHSLFLKADGTLWGIGANNHGELGLGTTEQQVLPVQIAQNVIAFDAGEGHTLFVTADRRLWAMGQNSSGQLGDGTGTNRLSPVEIAAGVEKISAGAGFSLFVRTDGTLWGMGHNGSGQFGIGRTSYNNYTPLQLTWRPVPGITTHPASQTVSVGDNLTFSVTATGIAPLSYQWRKDGVNIGGATGADYSINGATTTDAGSYDVVVSDVGGSVTSHVATLTVYRLAQTITFAALADRTFTSTPFVLGATASSGLPVTFAIDAGPATIVGNEVTLTGPGTVIVSAMQVGDDTFAPAVMVHRSFIVTSAGFASWQTGKFTAGELSDAAISGPNADPDHDGFGNLVEYALGLEPKAASTSGLPGVGTAGSDWVYTYTRPDSIAGVTYTVEVSFDLISWTTNGVTTELVSNVGGIETWRARHPLTGVPKIFFRLQITQP